MAGKGQHSSAAQQASLTNRIPGHGRESRVETSGSRAKAVGQASGVCRVKKHSQQATARQASLPCSACVSMFEAMRTGRMPGARAAYTTPAAAPVFVMDICLDVRATGWHLQSTTISYGKVPVWYHSTYPGVRHSEYL